jgi:hypothetical protein
MVAKQVGIFPVCLKGHNTPAISACSGADGFAFRFATELAKCAAVVGYGE